MLKAAKLLAPKAWAFVDGVVRDISETGARIECDFVHLVQDEFRLLIVTNATIRPCRVVWRGKKEMGVAFMGDAQPAPQEGSKPLRSRIARVDLSDVVVA